MGKILLIEDEKSVQILYKQQFEKDGFQVVVASGGKDGLYQAATEVPDFILLDLMLPELDGMSVLKLLKESDKTKNIPVAIFTSLPHEEPLISGGGLDKAVAYWLKDDFSPAELVNEVKKQLSPA